MDDLKLHFENSRWFKCVLVVGMLLFAFYASTHMVAAGDTWVALACGRHFANHGVDNVEPFSFNSHPAGPSEETLSKFPDWTHGIIKKWHPTGWINQNWLTHLIFYEIASWFGSGETYNYNTLVYWKFIVYFLTVICVYATGNLLGAGPVLSAAGACLAMLVGRTFYDIRPAGYSNLLVPAFILVLALTTYRNYRLIWLMVPLVVFWANVHGGYIYSFIMLVPFIGIHILLRLPRRWSICLGFVGLWLVLYLISYKFIHNHNYVQVQELLGKDVLSSPLLKDKLFIIWLILAAISVLLTVLKNVKSSLFYAYHIGAYIIYFLSVGSCFFLAEIPRNLTSQFKVIYSSFVTSSQLSFVFVFAVGGLLVLAMAFKKDRFVGLPLRGIYHTIASSVAAFLAMILFNPFHLTNLTHTFEISVSEHAASWRQVNEWRPAFDWMDKTTTTPNPVGEEEWFAALCIMTLAVLLTWLTAHLLKPDTRNKGPRKQRTDNPSQNGFEWPKIDLAIVIISLLTIYMAIRSRRFIAIAGSAATPALAVMIIQSWKMMSARFHRNKDGLFQPITLPMPLYRAVQIGICLLLVSLGVFWGLKYKNIYLDPSPTDNRYYTIFMRMTASHLKPFGVCEFINDNHISGRVFNYWTEGGAVAFGQTPDPETGKIPLKLFMDGRAQAAYNHDKFRLWQLIHSGGPVVQQARMQRKKITADILKESGQWIDTTLKKYDVWVTLMPQAQENSTFMNALKKTDNWKTAYLDNTQHLLVDTDTPQGRALVDSILKDKAAFPDAFSKNLTTATVIIETNWQERFNELYTLLSDAFHEYPYPTAALALTRLSGSAVYREKTVNLFLSYLKDLNENLDAYRQQNGMLLRLSSANVAARFLVKVRPEEKEQYLNQAKLFQAELSQLTSKAIW